MVKSPDLLAYTLPARTYPPRRAPSPVLTLPHSPARPAHPHTHARRELPQRRASSGPRQRPASARTHTRPHTLTKHSLSLTRPNGPATGAPPSRPARHSTAPPAPPLTRPPNIRLPSLSDATLPKVSATQLHYTQPRAPPHPSSPPEGRTPSPTLPVRHPTAMAPRCRLGKLLAVRVPSPACPASLPHQTLRRHHPSLSRRRPPTLCVRYPPCRLAWS